MLYSAAVSGESGLKLPQAAATAMPLTRDNRHHTTFAFRYVESKQVTVKISSLAEGVRCTFMQWRWCQRRWDCAGHIAQNICAVQQRLTTYGAIMLCIGTMSRFCYCDIDTVTAASISAVTRL